MKKELSVDIVIPVYNEEDVIEQSVVKLRNYLIGSNFPYKWRIIVSDNNSNDGTRVICERMDEKFDDFSYLHIPVKGRGIALKTAFIKSDADIISYMDADLSTDLEAYSRLIDAIIVDGNHISIGSRLVKGSKITRSVKREITSRGYNFMLRILFLKKFSDAQVGFKAYRADVVKRILPYVKDELWFFDTELLVLAERMNYKIKDIPIIWDDDPNSTVDVAGTSWKLLKDSFALKRRLIRGI